MSAALTGVEPTGRPIEADPLFAQALNLMQQGQWPEAGDALVALDRRYPSSEELRKARQLLALRLSAEATWRGAAQRQVASWVRSPAIRALLIANLVLYTLLGAICLWSGSGGLLP